jgi:SAM-dependent methyltransferase
MGANGDAPTLSPVQREELGDISGKKLMHLQCNTGADTLSLARLGAQVTGVDLVPEHGHYANKLAADLGLEEARFLRANLLEVMDVHDEQHDIVFTTEGVLVWLPDLALWARNVRHLLKDDGCQYVLDGHPFFMALDMVVEAGFCAVDPMEVKAGNDPLRIARNYRDQLAFIGGLDVRVLESGDRDHIRDEVTRLIQGMEAAEARYIYISDHLVSTNVDYDDFRFSLDVYREHMMC